MNILSVTTTLSNEKEAKQFSSALIQKKLAACVQLSGPIRSHYQWKGDLCDDNEVQLTIKTAVDREADLLQAFESEHPYEVPQILIHEERSSSAYASWVVDETRPN